MSSADRHDEPGSVNQDPSMVEDRVAQRNRLAQLLGRLLARTWLRQRENKGEMASQEDSQKT